MARKRNLFATFSRCNKDHAVGQQRGRVKSACGVEVARDSPCPARRIVQFRARRSNEGVIKSPCNKDHAVGQQGRRVSLAFCV